MDSCQNLANRNWAINAVAKLQLARKELEGLETVRPGERPSTASNWVTATLEGMFRASAILDVGVKNPVTTGVFLTLVSLPIFLTVDLREAQTKPSR